MQMRGVEKQMASTVTTHYSGIFETDAALREEFLRLTSI
jgi:GTP cyclohydrolase I